MNDHVVIDVWGGSEGEVHLARFFRPLTTALQLAHRELKAGFQVNILGIGELTFGNESDFDRRVLN